MKDQYLILGVDQSVRSTGLCLINSSGNVEVAGALLHALEDPYRLKFAKDNILTWLTCYKPDIICYESMISQMRWNSKASGIVQLGELAGIMKLAFVEYQRTINPDAAFYRIPPDLLKNLRTGNTKAEKDEMMAAIPERHMSKIQKYVVGNSVNDCSDAYHLARTIYEILKDGYIKAVYKSKTVYHTLHDFYYFGSEIHQDEVQIPTDDPPKQKRAKRSPKAEKTTTDKEMNTNEQ